MSLTIITLHHLYMRKRPVPTIRAANPTVRSARLPAPVYSWIFEVVKLGLKALPVAVAVVFNEAWPVPVPALVGYAVVM